MTGDLMEAEAFTDAPIIACYPTMAGGIQADTAPLRALTSAISGWVPEGVGVHLLPFHPASGDGGFAVSDWTRVDPQLGTWQDIEAVAQGHTLAVDGVFNHVSWYHAWVGEATRDPHALRRFYSWKDLPSPVPKSPRGGDILRLHKFAYGCVWLWQTYGPDVVDIKLEDPDVFGSVLSHMELLRSHGVQILRLDAAAHYGKQLIAGRPDGSQAAAMVRSVTKEAQKRGLQVWIQMDCDEAGLQAAAGLRSVALQDFALSPSLAEALLTGDAHGLVQHLRNTWNMRNDVSLMRAPRTHDGIYLRSRMLDERTRSALVRLAKTKALHLRELDGEAYELSNSLPYLVRASGMNVYDGLLATAILIGLLPGIPYYYFPAFLGWVPEDNHKICLDDPRALNRIQSPGTQLPHILGGSYGTLLREVLMKIRVLRQVLPLGKELVGDDIHSRRGLITIKRGGSKGLRALVNLGKNPEHIDSLGRSPYLNHKLRNSRLLPGGFVVVREHDVEDSSL